MAVNFGTAGTSALPFEFSATDALDDNLLGPASARRDRKPDHTSKLKDIEDLNVERMLEIQKLELNPLLTNIGTPKPLDNHKTVNSMRVFSNLGANIFSVFFEPPRKDSLIYSPPEGSKFLSLIEEIERYMYEIVAMPNNENELHEDMRKHKKYIQESLDEIEHLERYFGILKVNSASLFSFKNIKPVTLQLDDD